MKMTVYLYATPHKTTLATSSDMRALGWVALGKKDIEFTEEDMLSDEEVRQNKVAALQAEREKLMVSGRLEEINAELKELGVEL